MLRNRLSCLDKRLDEIRAAPPSISPLSSLSSSSFSSSLSSSSLTASAAYRTTTTSTSTSSSKTTTTTTATSHPLPGTRDVVAAAATSMNRTSTSSKLFQGGEPRSRFEPRSMDFLDEDDSYYQSTSSLDSSFVVSISGSAAASGPFAASPSTAFSMLSGRWD